jgi:hypothetical protein
MRLKGRVGVGPAIPEQRPGLAGKYSINTAPTGRAMLAQGNALGNMTNKKNQPYRAAQRAVQSHTYHEHSPEGEKFFAPTFWIGQAQGVAQGLG